MAGLSEAENQLAWETWQIRQVDLASLSSQSTRVVADQSDHDIPLERPPRVVQAIRHVVDETRERSGPFAAAEAMETHPTPDAESTSAALGALVRQPRIPGLQYLVVDRADTVFEYAGGWADLSARRPMTAETTMMAYSMSKTITAAAVLQLVEAQKIALDSPIDQYLDSQSYGHDVTVRQLLLHTSGIPNPTPLRWVHPITRHAAFQEGAALSAVLQQHNRLSFAPGAKFAYSNIGYWLLGSIVERASGEPFTAYVHDHILRPLGIEPQALGYLVVYPANHATGYLEKYSLMNLIQRFVVDRALIGDYEGPWLEIRGHYIDGPAFGGLVGTTRGFGVFLQDQLRPHSRLFDDRTRNLFYEQQHTKQGAAIPMTLGWHIGATGGAGFFFKEGGGGGFHSMMRVYPGDGIGTVVMTNATGFDVRRLLDDMDPRFFRSAQNRQ